MTRSKPKVPPEPRDIELSEAWREAVAAGHISNEFEASRNDIDGQWLQGDRIRFGLTLSDGAIVYQARNLRTNAPIEATLDERTIGSTGFVCQYNGYRALRPGSAPQRLGAQATISGAADECRFFCQEPNRSLSLSSRTPLCRLNLPNASWNAYYNALPVEKEGHFLLVPGAAHERDPVLHVTQQLTRESVEDLVALFRQCTRMIVFFNGLHAGASVNHIHAQAVVHTRRLAIENASASSHKGLDILDGYPARAFCFCADARIAAVVECVERLQARSIPFNLIMIGERILVVPRNIEHEVVAEFPYGVLAAMEIVGKIIAVDRMAYECTDFAQIARAFEKTTLRADELIDD